VLATIPALDKTRATRLVEFHRTHFVPITRAWRFPATSRWRRREKLVESRLGAWKKAGVSVPAVTDPMPIGGTKIYFVARPNSVQTNLIVGLQAIERTNPTTTGSRYGTGSSAADRPAGCFIHLREEKSYTYGAYSGLTRRCTAATGPRRRTSAPRSPIPRCTDLLDESVRCASSRSPTRNWRRAAGDDRVVRAVAGIAADVLNYYVTLWRFKLPADYYDRYAERVSAVTKDQVRAMAQKYLDPARLQIVAVGDPTKVADVLKKLGEVESYDADEADHSQ